MLFIFIWRQFTGTSVGSAIRQVHCEQCHKLFGYEIVRMGLGSDASPYMLRDDLASDSAKEQAQRDLDRRLEKESDPVPCPHCGWMQTEMVQDLRGRQHAWVRTLVRGCWTLAAFVFFLATCIGYAANSTHDYWTTGFVWLLKLALWPVGIGVGLLLLRWLLAFRCSPNALYPVRAAAPPCAPVALLPGSDGKWAPAAPRKVLLDNGRVAVRLHGRPLPQACCSCLAAPETMYLPPKIPFAIKPPLGLPICHACARRIHRAAIGWTLAIPAVSLAIAYCVSLAVVNGGTSLRVAAAIPMSLVLAVPGLLFVPNWATTPYRVYRYDIRRRTCEMSFGNPAYAKAVADHQGGNDDLARHSNWNALPDETHLHPHSA